MSVKQAWRFYHLQIYLETNCRQNYLPDLFDRRELLSFYGPNEHEWLMWWCVTVKASRSHRRVGCLPVASVVTLAGRWFPCCFQPKYFLEPGFELVLWKETHKMFSLRWKQQRLWASQLLMANLLFVVLLLSALPADVEPLDSRSVVFFEVDEVVLESPEDDESEWCESNSDESSKILCL